MREESDQKRKAKVLTKEKLDLRQLFKAPEVGLSVAGQSVTRTDALSKATGRLMFGADYPQEGFLHGKILRSPHPHALIKSIKTERAEALPGVAAVLTAKDVPGRNGFGAIIPDQPVICGDKVRFVGDGVALVAADSEEVAQKALELIEVEYEPLPAIFDPCDALKEDAPKIHEKGNLLSLNKLRKGIVEKGFAEAEVIVERTYKVPFLEHAYLEPDVVMAIPQQDGTMLVEGPMQAPFTVRRNINAVLGVPINKVRVRQVHMGGGFGGKEDSPIDIGCRAAVLAHHTGRPVRLALDREEVTLQTCKRHPMIMEVKIGARKDGTIVALEGVIYDEQGAYASLGPVIPPAGGSHVHAMVMMPGPYEIPHVKVDAYLCYTNHPYGGAMRGFGAPQVHVAHEQVMDELAEELGMNPIDVWVFVTRWRPAQRHLIGTADTRTRVT
jgi:CO/xanthine dehydrogenase Mo-binding subunit